MMRSLEKTIAVKYRFIAPVAFVILIFSTNS